MSRRKRLDPSIFHLPVERMQTGYYSDKYFQRTREVLLADGHHPNVLMQVFSKAHAFLGASMKPSRFSSCARSHGMS